MDWIKLNLVLKKVTNLKFHSKCLHGGGGGGGGKPENFQ
jgi:hypothetical protein